MEKNFIISRLISIVLVFMPTFAFAQDDEPAIKIKTETYDGGITVETYEKGSSQYQIYRKKNGDYYVDKEPYEVRWTLKDKTLLTGNDNDLRIKFPNGNILFTKGRGFSKEYLLKSYIVDMPTLWEKLSECFFKMISFADENNHPGKIYPIKILKGDRSFVTKRTNYVLIGNDAFKFDLNGKLYFIGKEVIGIDKRNKGEKSEFKCFIYAIPTDSIIECVREYSEEKDCIKISYANGDEVFYNDDGLIDGTHIHRDNGILKIKKSNDTNTKNKYLFYLYLNDGKIFKGKGSVPFMGTYETYYTGLNPEFLQFPSLTPRDGTLINKDNTGIVLVGGMSEEEREKQIELEKEQARKKEEEREKQIELARKKEEANKKAGYDLLCKAYGKKYVDAAMNGKVIIGMPQDLFLLTFPITRLRSQTQSTKVYEVRNILNRIIKVVRVTNGRVSGITNY